MTLGSAQSVHVACLGQAHRVRLHPPHLAIPSGIRPSHEMVWSLGRAVQRHRGQVNQTLQIVSRWSGASLTTQGNGTAPAFLLQLQPTTRTSTIGRCLKDHQTTCQTTFSKTSKWWLEKAFCAWHPTQTTKSWAVAACLCSLKAKVCACKPPLSPLAIRGSLAQRWTTRALKNPGLRRAPWVCPNPTAGTCQTANCATAHH